MASRLKVEKSDMEHTEESDRPNYNAFRGPPRHVERVSSALTTYLEKVRDMRVAKANFLGRVVDMCPKQWKILPELRIFLEDQSMLWSLLASDLRSFFRRLKKYALLAESAKYALEEFESRLSEVHTMTDEFELMKKSPNVSSTQKLQIQYMLRESNRALVAIRNSVEEKLLSFRKSQTEIGKELLQKFEEAQRITCDEHMQVINMVMDRLNAVPIKKLTHNGQPEEDLEFVKTLIQAVIDSVWSTPVDLTARMEMYNKPKIITRPTGTVNQGPRNATGQRRSVSADQNQDQYYGYKQRLGRPISADQGQYSQDQGNYSEYKQGQSQGQYSGHTQGQGQGQYSGYKQAEGRGQVLKNLGPTARPYSSDAMAEQDQRPARIARPKTPTASVAEKEAFDSSLSLYSWRSGSSQIKPRSNEIGSSYNSSNKAQLSSAVLFSNGKSNVIRHVQAPSVNNTSYYLKPYPDNTTSPEARQNLGQNHGQIRTDRSSRPSSRASQQDPSTASNTHQQSQSQCQERTSRSSRPSSRTSQQDPSAVSNKQYQNQSQSQGQGQGRTSRSSRPSSRASRQDPNAVSDTHHQSERCTRQSTSRGFKTVECDRSIEDLYSFCKPSKVRASTSPHRTSRLPYKSTPFRASCYDDIEPDFYDCQ